MSEPKRARQAIAIAAARSACSGSSAFTRRTGASIMRVTSVQYCAGQALIGLGSVKPTWLLMITCTVPPTV